MEQTGICKADWMLVWVNSNLKGLLRMKFFKYIKGSESRSMTDMLKIFETVQSLDKYAKKIYRSRWEDALDMAFFHVLQNYDPSKGELENYTIKVIGGILLNQFKKEYPYEFIADLGSQQEELTADVIVREDEGSRSSNVKSCIKFMAPLFLKDFRFFESMTGQYRKEGYSELFEKFTGDAIQKATAYLRENYSSKVKVVYDSKKRCGGKKLDEEMGKRNLDTNLEYIMELNDTVVYRKRKKSNIVRYIYSVDLKRTASELMVRFYSGDFSKAHARVEGANIYCSMTGTMVYSEEDLFKTLTLDIVGIVLARTSLKLLKFKEEDEAIFVSTSELKYDLNMTLFGEEVWLRFIQRSSKEVEMEGKAAC